MRRSQLPPALGLANPLVEIAVARVHTRFDTYCARVAPSFPDIATQALDDLAHLLVGSSLRQPAVAQACGPAQEHIRSSAQPYRNGTTHRQGVETSFGDGMKLTLVGDDLLAPQQAHDLDLLL